MDGASERGTGDKRATIERTLNRFEESFSDYSTYYYLFDKTSGSKHSKDSYHEICFTTAGSFYGFARKKTISKKKDIDILIENLDRKIVVYLEYLMKSSESHGICFFTIPETQEVVTVQSTGGLFVATHEYISIKKFKKIMKQFMSNDDPITHLGNAHPVKLLKLKISTRWKINEKILPKFTPKQKTKIEQLRYDWMVEDWNCLDEIDESYITDRKPDMKDYYLRLHGIDLNNKQFIRDIKDARDNNYNYTEFSSSDTETES